MADKEKADKRRSSNGSGHHGHHGSGSHGGRKDKDRGQQAQSKNN